LKVEGVNLFIDQMNPDDHIVVVPFNDRIIELRPVGAVGEVGESLKYISLSLHTSRLSAEECFARPA